MIGNGKQTGLHRVNHTNQSTAPSLHSPRIKISNDQRTKQVTEASNRSKQRTQATEAGNRSMQQKQATTQTNQTNPRTTSSIHRVRHHTLRTTETPTTNNQHRTPGQPLPRIVDRGNLTCLSLWVAGPTNDSITGRRHTPLKNPNAAMIANVCSRPQPKKTFSFSRHDKDKRGVARGGGGREKEKKKKGLQQTTALQYAEKQSIQNIKRLLQQPKCTHPTMQASNHQPLRPILISLTQNLPRCSQCMWDTD